MTDKEMTEKEMTEKTCQDKNCPFHGQLNTRGRKFKGRITSDRMNRTVAIKLVHVREIPKYERYEKRTSSLKAHLPKCITAKKGDIVIAEECRPISKTKSFVVTKIA